ncbi:sulfite exporter TauE/SafE family protein [Lentibacter sp.]|uniref:sulfite exporter TauE/SafE family protein n=1 Tax=Lentibacter sp. TaxID=2024994 RepID=UPI003F6A78EB
MDIFLSGLTPSLFLIALTVTLLAGVVKGMVGFAMPMIMISGLSSFIAPELALAALILPTVATNALQALRQGPREALASVKSFKVFLLVGGVMLLLSAQLVSIVPAHILLLAIGVVVSLFTGLQLLGWSPTVSSASKGLEALFGAVAGAIGGISGIWGPPTVMYLNAMDVAKKEALRIQGVIYGLGAVLLLISHIGSGVINARTLPFSAIMLLPAVAGLWIGFKLHDRIDQKSFRRLTQVVLFIAGLNLVRRGLMG